MLYVHFFSFNVYSKSFYRIMTYLPYLLPDSLSRITDKVNLLCTVHNGGVKLLSSERKEGDIFPVSLFKGICHRY